MPPFRLHPSHLTHMAPAWTRSPELSPSLQTTHSRCSTALSPFQGSVVYRIKDISEAFFHGQDSYGQPVEVFGAPVLTDASPVVVTSSDNLPASEAFGVPVPVGTSAPGTRDQQMESLISFQFPMTLSPWTVRRPPPLTRTRPTACSSRWPLRAKLLT